jgi:hypothetical protein
MIAVAVMLATLGETIDRNVLRRSAWEVNWDPRNRRQSQAGTEAITLHSLQLPFVKHSACQQRGAMIS